MLLIFFFFLHSQQIDTIGVDVVHAVSLSLTFLDTGITNFSVFYIREFWSQHIEQSLNFSCSNSKSVRDQTRREGVRKRMAFLGRILHKSFWFSCVIAIILLCDSSQLVGEYSNELCYH